MVEPKQTYPRFAKSWHYVKTHNARRENGSNKDRGQSHMQKTSQKVRALGVGCNRSGHNDRALEHGQPLSVEVDHPSALPFAIEVQ